MADERAIYTTISTNWSYLLCPGEHALLLVVYEAHGWHTSFQLGSGEARIRSILYNVVKFKTAIWTGSFPILFRSDIGSVIAEAVEQGEVGEYHYGSCWAGARSCTESLKLPLVQVWSTRYHHKSNIDCTNRLKLSCREQNSVGSWFNLTSKAAPILLV